MIHLFNKHKFPIVEDYKNKVSSILLVIVISTFLSSQIDQIYI